MKWLKENLPIFVAAGVLLWWFSSTFAQQSWVKEYVDIRHEQVVKILERIETKVWELSKKD